MSAPCTWLLPLLWISGLSAQEILIDSGTTQPIPSPVFATSYVWKFNGDIVSDQTTNTFTYSPIRKDVGTHWLELEATLPSGAKSEHHWRLPFFTKPTPAKLRGSRAAHPFPHNR